MSMIRDLTDRGWAGAMYLVYAVKTERDLAFKDEIAFLKSRCPNLSVLVTLSRPEGDAWTGHRGRVSRELLRRVGANLERSPVYICGPEGMMSTTTATLLELGVSSSQIRTEAFVSPRHDNAAEEPGPLPVGRATEDEVHRRAPSIGGAVVRFRLSAKSG